MREQRSLGACLKEAGVWTTRDKVPTMGAAIAYYGVFSLAPMLVIALGIAGMVFGAGGGERVYAAIGGMLGPSAAMTVRGMAQSAASRPQSGMIAAIIGLATLIFGATGVFGQLQDSLNVIFKVQPKPDAGVASTIGHRLLGIVMIAIIAVLVPSSLLLGAIILNAGGALGAFPGGTAALQTLNEVVALLVTTGLFAALFKVLPDVRLVWKDALTGGLFTAVLFTIGKYLLAVYLGRSGIESVYGAAGSIIAVLLWVYYSAQIVLIGAEFTRAYATREGHEVIPARYAVTTETPILAMNPEPDGAAPRRTTDGAETERREPTVTTPPEEEPAVFFGASAAALAAGGLLLNNARHARGNRAVAEEVGGGILVGAAAAVLGLWELAHVRDGHGKEKKEEGPSTASKLISKIPTKVKVATVVGAVKGGGGEAIREVGDKIKSSTTRRDNRRH